MLMSDEAYTALDVDGYWEIPAFVVFSSWHWL